MSYENENNGLDGEITQVTEDICNLENEISNAQNDLIKLQGDIAEVNALSDKYKSEAIHYQRSAQA